MWVSLIRPHIDYCSQLWSPGEGPLLDSIERLQYDYTKLSPETRNLTYTERLKKFAITSIQRRFERYKIMYLYKINQKVVPNCGVTIASDRNTRCGLKYVIPMIKESANGTLLEQTFQISGPKIWNVLPVFIRNLDGDDQSHFKSELDNYLMNFEDIPRVGHSKMRKNSLIDILGF